jgi:pilus assembly protein Flp/PilA
MNREQSKTTQRSTNKKEREMERIKNFFKDESGATAVEYGLMVALIAVVIIAAVRLLGTNLQQTFNNTATEIGGT